MASAAEADARARSRSITSSNNASTHGTDRLEPRLLKACASDSISDLHDVIAIARETGQLTDGFLRVGLMRACERGGISAVRYLLEMGALPDSNPQGGKDGGGRVTASPLLKAVERNHVRVVQILLDYGAAPETRDRKGRTALMTAAWRNHFHVLQVLIDRGANVNATDNRGRNVLHNLAADKTCDWGEDVVTLLLSTVCAVDAGDELGRTPLHWACATGKERFAEMMLIRPLLVITRRRGAGLGGPAMAGADVNAVEGRNKTALHLAVAHGKHGNESIVALLLRHGADVNARSDGGCESIARRLIAAGAKINAQLLNGISPLHLAAQGGHREVVECLLERNDLKQRLRDNFGSTPFLRAAQFKRKDIALGEYARGACEGFEATNRVKRTSVFNLLYGRDTENYRKQAFNALPMHSRATEFRWIHLPANNLAWVEALLTKAFIEEGAHDVDSFKGLERSFNYQHRGQKMHSNFMRPLCQSTQRAPKYHDIVDNKEEKAEEVQSPKILINGLSRDLPSPPVPPPSPKPDGKKKQRPSGKVERLDSQDDNQSASGKKGKKGSAGTPKGLKSPPIRRDKSPHPTLCKDKNDEPERNICYFMPYLHFETVEGRNRMQEAIRKTQQTQTPPRPGLDRTPTRDELLLRAHLTSSSTSLHIRRTLDQFFYPNIDTQTRDQDQVVYRYQKKRSRVPEPKIFMVDQLWMWILGPSLIPKNDPLNVLDGIIEDINSKTRDPVRSVYDLAITITNRCSGFLDMFESHLFNRFNRASAQASDWLKNHRKHNKFARRQEKVAKNLDKEEKKKQDSDEVDDEPLFVDELLDIGQETDLLAEAKDIRDELNMIRMVLHYQKNVLDDFEKVVSEIYLGQHQNQRDMKKRFGEQQRTIDIHLKDIDRMDKQAERIYSSITDLLDLKQKHANAFEARFARDQAAGTARQGKILMVFTIVTIVFLPLSFITSVFTINMPEFEDNLTMGYVAKYTFGIGFGLSIPLVLLALVLDDIGDIFQEGLRRARGWIRTSRHSKNQLLLDRMRTQRQSRERTLLPTRERTRERDREVLELDFDKTV
ncbi:hypothetical protein BDW74DRAFT_186228 [Aspergillus multicolor]|uniref:ankyrin repeat protein n=1 Tax=Aspergillus multicolor TaxID=41759 RepID=UPI003CCD3B2B